MAEPETLIMSLFKPDDARVALAVAAEVEVSLPVVVDEDPGIEEPAVRP